MIKSLLIRVMSLCAILAALSLFLPGRNLFLPLGILIGGLLSVYKLRMFKIVLTGLTQNEKNSFIKSFVVSMFLLSLSFIVLLAAVKLDTWLFFGIAAGFVALPVVISISAFFNRIKL